MADTKDTSVSGATVRVLAAVLGTLPVAIALCVCIARFAPLAQPTRFALGFALVIPVWLGAMCLGFLARSGARAWATCLALCTLAATALYALPS